MSSSSVLIKGGTVVNEDCMERADVLCENGKITKIASSIEATDGVQIVDATDKLVIPGGIDPHTHCQLPFMGTVAADDFNHGTRAALAGGTTCLVDFCIPTKGESLLEAYKVRCCTARTCLPCVIRILYTSFSSTHAYANALGYTSLLVSILRNGVAGRIQRSIVTTDSMLRLPGGTRKELSPTRWRSL